MAPTAETMASPAPLTTFPTSGSQDALGTNGSNNDNTLDYTLEYIRSLTDVAQIQECLRQLALEENKVDADLDQLLEDQEELEAKLDKLEILGPQLGGLQTESKSLVKIIGDTSGIAESISVKVRQLDLEQSRVKTAIKHVEDVQELKYCISGVQRALEQSDYEDAARHIHRALQFDPKILQGSFAEISVPSAANPDHPTVLLANFKANLLEIISSEFDMAVQVQSAEDITRYFKLFPLLGEEQAGLDKYSRFVCAIVSGKAQASLAEPPSKVPTFYADTLIRLFESVAVIIDQHQPVVEKYYGAGKMLRVIQKLQEESDVRSQKVLEAFKEEREISRKIHEIKSFRDTARRIPAPTAPVRTMTPQPGMSNAQLNATQIPELINPRELDVVLNEMAMISQRAQLYNRFLESRAKSELELLTENEASAIPSEATGGATTAISDTIVAKTGTTADKKQYNKTTGLLQVSGLSRGVQEVMDDYLVIEEFFLRRSVDKAMAIDEHDQGSFTSSCVDDVFYILKKTISRAVYTANADYLAAMINFIQRTLEVDYMAVFQKDMQSTFANGDSKEARFQYMILLNNVNISADYLEKLTAEVEQDTLSALSEQGLAKAKAVLAGLLTSSQKFKQLQTNGIDFLFSQTIEGKIRPLLQDSYKDIKYVVTDEEYAEQEARNSFVHRFMAGFDALLSQYKQGLTEENLNQIIVNTVDSLTKLWERIIFQTKFNKLGALRFDKDLRAIGFYLISLTAFPLRDKLIRLNQVSMLLDLDELQDLYDIWGNNAGAITWRLTVPQVRRILCLRIDFVPEEVANMAL